MSNHKNEFKCIKDHYSWDKDGNLVLIFKKGKRYKSEFVYSDIFEDYIRLIKCEISNDDYKTWWYLSTKKRKIYFK